MTDSAIPTPDASGLTAYIATPSQTPAAAIIVIQEIFGVNGFIRSVCDDYARAGYLAIAPDLFWRLEPGIQLDSRIPADYEKARACHQKFDLEKGLADLKATLDFARNHPACNGTVGTVGYCLGGKLAFLMACRTKIDAAISYYGVDLPRFLPEAEKISNPCMLHIPEEDAHVSKPDQQKIRDTLGGNAHTVLHFYPGLDHAFARPTGQNFNAAGATLANQRSFDFFAAALARRVAA